MKSCRNWDFIELNACSGGVWAAFSPRKTECGTGTDPAPAQISAVSCNRLQDAGDPERLEWTEQLEYAPVMPGGQCGGGHAPDEGDRLHLRPAAAAGLRLLRRSHLPGRWRRMSCGDWPGKATAFFRMRQEIQEIASRLVSIEGYRFLR